MVGAGVFSLPRNFAMATGPFGALIAWAIAGGGMLMLAFVFQTLAQRKPDIDAGIYAYARAGFGDYLGFLAAFGFWAGTCVGNVTYWVLIKSTLGAAIPVFGEGNTVPAVLVSSVGLWAFYFLILRGVKEAAFINQVVTFAKMVPLVLFVVIVAFAFKADVFAANFWGGAGADYTPLFQQVSRTMLVTVFVFLGIEGASVYSRFAKKREDVGRATVLGFLGVLALFMAVTMLSYGVMRRQDLAGAASAVGSRRARGGGRTLGRGLHQRRPDHLGARRLHGLDAAGGGGTLQRRQRRGSCRRSSRTRTRTRCRRPRCCSPPRWCRCSSSPPSSRPTPSPSRSSCAAHCR